MDNNEIKMEDDKYFKYFIYAEILIKDGRQIQMRVKQKYAKYVTIYFICFIFRKKFGN